jgi:bacterioferritin-associated ferredoxin
MLLTIILICINFSSMYICICKQVTDHQIKEAVSNGACSFQEVQSQLGVATECGECKCHARKCMRKSTSCQTEISQTSTTITLAASSA